MGVAVQRPFGVSVLRLVTGQVPDDERLVTAGGQEHVGAVSDGESAFPLFLARTQDVIDGFVRTSPWR